MLETAWIKRCSVCMFKWEASAVKSEDGTEKCPNCIDHRTEAWKADTEAREAARAAAGEPKPQVSQAPLDTPFPATIRTMTDVNGTRVSQSAPLSLTRGVAKTLLLLGREFSSADAISASPGISVAVSARTASLTTLAITADPAQTAGNYDLTFNDSVWRNVFRV